MDKETGRLCRMMMVVAALLVFSGLQAQTNRFTKVVTPADVQSVSALKGVRLLSSDPANDGMLASLMFARSDGTMLVMINFAKAGTFVMDKQHAVAGVGDEAFESSDHSSLCFRKGAQPVVMASGVTADPKTGVRPLLTQDQLRTLAKLIYSRL